MTPTLLEGTVVCASYAIFVEYCNSFFEGLCEGDGLTCFVICIKIVLRLCWTELGDGLSRCWVLLGWVRTHGREFRKTGTSPSPTWSAAGCMAVSAWRS